MKRHEALVFVGFNKRVAALVKKTGEIRWQWKASQGSGYVSLLLDRDRLFASVDGYTYCLKASTGEQMWFNPMKGFGTGVTSLACSGGHSAHSVLGQAAVADAAAASTASTGVAT